MDVPLYLSSSSYFDDDKDRLRPAPAAIASVRKYPARGDNEKLVDFVSSVVLPSNCDLYFWKLTPNDPPARNLPFSIWAVAFKHDRATHSVRDNFFIIKFRCLQLVLNPAVFSIKSIAATTKWVKRLSQKMIAL